MSNEKLELVANQTAGEIKWNYDELKSAVEAKMEEYASLTYTDDTIKDAKKDRATLNKLTKAIKEKKTEVKKQFLAPFDAFSAQADEIIKLIEKPLARLDENVKDYEKRAKEAKKKEITDYWNSKVEQLPGVIREKAWASIYDDSWTNATATKKAYKEGIDNGIVSILKDIDAIESMESDYQAAGYKEYVNTLSLSDAIAKMNQLQKQHDEIVKREQERIEAEARRKAETERRATEEEQRRQLEAERARIREEEAAKLRAEQEKAQAGTEEIQKAVTSAPQRKNVDAVTQGLVQPVVKNVDNNVENHANASKNDCYMIKIARDDKVLADLKEYMTMMEIEYEVI